MKSLVFTDIATILLLCLQSSTITFFFYNMLTPKYSFRRSLFISCLVEYTIILATYGDYSNMALRQGLHFTAFLVLCRLLYRSAWRTICFSIVCMLILAFSCDFLALFLLYVCFPVIKGFPDGKYLLLGNLLFTILYLTCIFFFLLLWRRIKNKLLPKSIFAAIIFPASQFFLVEAVIYYVTRQVAAGSSDLFPLVSVLVGIILCAAADITLFQVMLSNSAKERLAAQLEIMTRQASRELEYYRSINEKMMEIRKIRHDFNNQLQTAYSLIAKDEEHGKEEALALLRQLEAHIKESSPVCFCPNMIVNVILEEKSRIARSQGIDMDISVPLPKQLSIEKADLCSIFSNLLDNAIHAVQAIPTDDTDRNIRVRAQILAGYCIITVSNPLPGAPDSRSTDKRDPEFHGYGLPILHSIAEKYKGEFTICTDHGHFTSDIKLKLEELREDSDENTDL